MNLGAFEAPVLRRLSDTLGSTIQWRRGPVRSDPASGLLAEVFLHAARFEDLDGQLPGGGGARAGHWPAQVGNAHGWREARPARIEFDVGCVCGRPDQAQELSGHVVPIVLETLSRLADVRLTAPSDAERVLRFAHHDAVIVRQAAAWMDDAACVTTTLRMTGVLQVQVVAADGLAAIDPYARPITLQLEAGPAGSDIAAERVRLSLERGDPVDLAGWQIRDAAGHVHRFAPGTRLTVDHELSLWSGRGKATPTDVYWGRRKPVWNNTGDIALLLDPDGHERARASWQPPLPPVRRPRGKR